MSFKLFAEKKPSQLAGFVEIFIMCYVFAFSNLSENIKLFYF